MADNYHDKQAAKLAYHEEQEQKRLSELNAQRKHVQSMVDNGPPFGQPILVGHHSEKRHRKYIERFGQAVEKSILLEKKADYHAEKIENIENPHAISSDDPEAVQKLKEKLAGIEARIEAVKEHNKKAASFVHLSLFPGHYRGDCKDYVFTNTNGHYKRYATINDNTKEITWLIKSVKPAIRAMIENYAKTGKLEQTELTDDQKCFDPYVLQNLNGNKTRVKDRIAYLEKLAQVKPVEESNNGITYQVDTSENRVKIFFPGKPSDEIRTKLKRSGWRWSPFNGCWQKMIDVNGYAAAQAGEYCGLVEEGLTQ